MERLERQKLWSGWWLVALSVWLGHGLTVMAQTTFTGPGRYRIEIVASGKLLDLKMEDKRTVQQWALADGHNQQWLIEDAGGGFYVLRSADNQMVLDFPEVRSFGGSRYRDGTPVSVAEARNAETQKWKLNDVGNGQYTIVSKVGRALEVAAQTRANDGAVMQIGTPHGLENQRFRLTRLGDLASTNTDARNLPARNRPGTASPAPTINTDPNARYSGTGRYRIQFVHSDKYLDLRMEDLETIQQWSEGGRSQLWDVEDAGGGFVYLRSVENGKALTLGSVRPQNGTPVTAQTPTYAETQKWRIVDLGNGEYSLVARAGGALDIHDFSKENGTKAQVWQANQQINQRLRFLRAAQQVDTYVRGRERGSAPTMSTPDPAPTNPVPQNPAPTVEAPYTPGSVRWRGRVDIEVLLDVRGNTITERSIGGQAFNNGRYTFSAPHPARSLSPRLRVLKARGSVEIAETPSAANNWTTVIRLKDPQGSAADYEFELTW